MFRLWALASLLQAVLAIGAGVAAFYLAGSDPWLALRDLGLFLVMAAGAALSLGQYAKRRNRSRRPPPPDNFFT
jgi:hypothetical protein